MKNPLVKRFPRELKSEFGKYLIIFLFIAGTISITSGWNVAGNRMMKALKNTVLRTETLNYMRRQTAISFQI